MPDLSAGGVTGFRIAEGFIEVDTRFDDNRLQRTAKRSFDRLQQIGSGALGKLTSTIASMASGVFETANKLAGQAAQSVLGVGTSLATAAISGGAMTASTGGLNIVLGALVAIVGALVLAVPILVGGFLALAPAMMLAGGSAGAMTTALFGLIAAGATLKLGLTGIGDAMSELAKDGKITDETLKKLSPNAIKLVRALNELRAPFERMRKFVQDRLLQGMAKEIRELADRWIPALKKILGAMADDLNAFGRALINAFTKKSFIDDMRVASAAFGDMIRDIGTRAVPKLIEALGNLASQSTPVLKAIGDIIVRIFNGFSNWINSANKTGKLKTFMADAAVSITQLFNIGGLAFKILGNLVKILFPGSKDASGGVLGSIEGFLTRINNWLSKPENQKKIQDWVNNALKKIKEFIEEVRTKWIPRIQEWVVRIEGWLIKIESWIARVEGWADTTKRTWATIKATWQAGLGFIMAIVGALLGQTKLLTTGVTLMRDAIGSRFNNIKTAGTGWLNHMRDRVFGPMRTLAAVTTPAGFASMAASVAARFNGMRASLSATWNNIKAGVFDRLNTMVRSTVPAMFQAGTTAIGNAWNRLRALARSPIDFVVNTVIQKGLVENFNKISSVFSGPRLPNVSFRGDGPGPTNRKPGTGDGIGDVLAGPAKWVAGKMGLHRIAERFGTNPFTKLLFGAGNQIKNVAIKKLKDLVSALDFGGGGSAGAGGLQGAIAGLLSVMRKIFPGLKLISGLRPGARTLSGNQSYHALGRAVDLPAIRAVAILIKKVFGGRIKELITPWRDLNMQNGRPHRYSHDVEAQHGVFGRNAHIHAALDDGGFRVLRPGINVIPNGTGRNEPIAGPAAMAAMSRGDTFVFHDGAVKIDMSKIRDVEDFLSMLRGLKSTSRQFAVSGVSAR